MFWGEGSRTSVCFKFVFDFNFLIFFSFLFKSRIYRLFRQQIWLLNFFFRNLSISRLSSFSSFFSTISSLPICFFFPAPTSLPIFHQKNFSLCLYFFLSRRRLTPTQTHDSIANTRRSSFSSSVMEKRPMVYSFF
jgi:hypothetical protein